MLYISIHVPVIARAIARSNLYGLDCFGEFTPNKENVLAWQLFAFTIDFCTIVYLILNVPVFVFTFPVPPNRTFIFTCIFPCAIFDVISAI